MHPLCNIHYKVEIYGNQWEVSTISAALNFSCQSWRFNIVLYARPDFSTHSQGAFGRRFQPRVPHLSPPSQWTSRVAQLSRICTACFNPNPPDHLYCHQCGSRLRERVGPELAVTEAAGAVERRPPDETRLPPAGSFRSGVYGLLRAVLYRQGAAAFRPEAADGATATGPPAQPEYEPATASPPPADAGCPAASAVGPVLVTLQRQRGPLTGAAHWLSRAMLIRYVLQRSDVAPSREPALPDERQDMP